VGAGFSGVAAGFGSSFLRWFFAYVTRGRGSRIISPAGLPSSTERPPPR
jgi:hypothetical protein